VTSLVRRIVIVLPKNFKGTHLFVAFEADHARSQHRSGVLGVHDYKHCGLLFANLNTDADGAILQTRVSGTGGRDGACESD